MSTTQVNLGHPNTHVRSDPETNKRLLTGAVIGLGVATVAGLAVLGVNAARDGDAGDAAAVASPAAVSSYQLVQQSIDDALAERAAAQSATAGPEIVRDVGWPWYRQGPAVAGLPSARFYKSCMLAAGGTADSMERAGERCGAAADDVERGPSQPTTGGPFGTYR